MKKYLSIIFVCFLSCLFFLSCDELDSPDAYLQIPGVIQISSVTYDANYNHYVNLYWDKYLSSFSSFQLTRDSKIIANMSADKLSYTDKVSTGTYEYRLYAIKGSITSQPSYIKIQVTSYNYYYWYE